MSEILIVALCFMPLAIYILLNLEPKSKIPTKEVFRKYLPEKNVDKGFRETRTE